MPCSPRSSPRSLRSWARSAFATSTRRWRRQCVRSSWPASSSALPSCSGKAGGVGEIPRRAFLFIVFSGAAGAASWFFYFLALRDGTATGVAALDRLSVVLVFILALVFLGEAFSVKAALGAILVVAGAILLT